MTPADLDYLDLLSRDLPTFAEDALYIKDKQQGIYTPFIMNQAQRLVHQRLENQKSKGGYVRAVVVKARQLGMSTYTAARYFHRALFVPDTSVFVIAHRADSTQHLYGFARNFYERLPEPFKEKLIKDNAQDLVLANRSSYAAGTAGSSDVGRGLTINCLHASEISSWANGADISIGLGQAVPSAPGTEIILESTAKGSGDYFHSRAMAAAENTNLVTGELKNPLDYQLIFIPFCWQKEYTRENTTDERPTDEEQELLAAHKDIGLTFEHLLWRRSKLNEILVGGDMDAARMRFANDYPLSIEQAFMANTNGFFPALYIQQALLAYKDHEKSQAEDQGACVIGVDPARNRDKTVIAIRRGKRITRIIRYDSMDEMRLAGIIARLIESEDPEAVFVDVGYGFGTIDRLQELGFGKIVKGVSFGERALNPQVWRNKRAEMHGEYRDWLENGGMIPDDKHLLDEMNNLPPEKEGSSGTGKYLVSKDDIRDIIGRSPDTLDAVCLTFAYPVRSRVEVTATRERRERKSSIANKKKDWFHAFINRR